MTNFYRTREVYWIEEETGKDIEDFLDADCFDEVEESEDED